MKCQFFLLLLVPILLFAQTPQSKPDWSAWQSLLGEWSGSGTGSPGTGTGTFTFALDLQDRVITRRNVADYPAMKGQTASRHEDLMIIYQQPDHSTRADYYDNEGHTIRYAVEFSKDNNSVVFLSDSIHAQPRFRMTYTKTGATQLGFVFAVAPTGKGEGWETYVTASAHKK